MDVINKEDKNEVLALGRLYEFCSNKRFHLLKNEFLSDRIGKIALKINNNIKITDGVDIFESKTDNDLLAYERILNDYVTNKVKKIVDLEEVGEEMDLLKLGIPFPIDRMKSFNINMSDVIKQYLKDFNLNVPEIISICKKPDYVSYVEDSMSLFVCSKAKIKNKERIVLLHISESQPGRSTTQVYKYSDRNRILRSSFFPKKETINTNQDIRMFFVLSEEKFGHLLNNPIRLFIKCLDLYGAKVEVNHIIKKFHKNIILPPHFELSPDFYHIVGDKEQSRTVSGLIVTNLSLRIIYLYSIYIGRHILDFKKGII